MTKKEIIFIILLLFMVAYGGTNYLHREQFEVAESQLSKSTDSHFVLYVQSGETKGAPYCKIFVFNTVATPSLKMDGTTPTKRELHNPLALFYLPVKLYARTSTIEWEEQNNLVRLKQAAVNDEASLNYEINLDTFSLQKI